MKLGEAKLCLDCDEIYTGEQCPRCGKTYYWWMSKYVPVMYCERQKAVVMQEMAERGEK
jgi:hypothetical protein